MTSNAHGWPRAGGGAAAAVALAALLAGPPPAASAERALLVTKAAWVDAAGQEGELLFQGEVVDGVLTGRAYPGDGSELLVAGTVDASGQVAGTLESADHTLLATFTGQLDAAGMLVGDLYFAGTLDGAWAAPAEALPAE